VGDNDVDDEFADQLRGAIVGDAILKALSGKELDASRRRRLASLENLASRPGSAGEGAAAQVHIDRLRAKLGGSVAAPPRAAAGSRRGPSAAGPGDRWENADRVMVTNHGKYRHFGSASGHRIDFNPHGPYGGAAGWSTSGATKQAAWASAKDHHERMEASASRPGGAQASGAQQQGTGPGRDIGATSSGKRVYHWSHPAYRRPAGPIPHNLESRMTEHYPGWSRTDHTDAAELHRKQSREWMIRGKPSESTRHRAAAEDHETMGFHISRRSAPTTRSRAR
jgi:hypothetical protein